MNTILKYQKTHGGYFVTSDGERIGFVESTWRKIYGGDCWSIRNADGRDEYFSTRKEAARELLTRHNAQKEA